MWIKKEGRVIEVAYTEAEFLATSLPGKGWVITTVPILSEPSVFIPNLSPWQARKVLRARNILSTVESVVTTLDDDAKDGWEYATYIERSNPLVEYVCTSVGMTSLEIDEMFIEGSKL